MSVSRSQISEGEKVKAKATVGSPEVRHQLQVMLTGKLADRGISTKELWNSSAKTKGKLSVQEQERLERQRYNKRRWAQKDRARSKALVDNLKQVNGALEYTNQQLKREVDRLREKKLRLKNVLTDHQCKVNDPKTFIRVPSPQERRKGKVTARAREKAGTKYSFFPVHSGQLGSPVSSAGKDDNTGRTLSPRLVPLTKTGFLVVDDHLASHSSCTSRHARQSKPSKSYFRTVTNLTALPGMSTVQKVTPKTENPIEDTDLKLKTDNIRDDKESQSSDTSDHAESVPSLTSGGFTISELTDSSKNYLQMFQGDDSDADMMENPNGTSKKRKKQCGQRHEDSDYPPEKRTPGNMTVLGGSESDDFKTVLILPPASSRQNWVKPAPDLGKRHQVSDHAGKLAVSTTVKPYVKDASERRSGSSNSYHTMNQSEAKKDHQATANTDVSHFPQKPDLALSKTAQHKTRKGVLMERWLAQEHTKRLAKKLIKPVSSHSLRTKTETQIVVNPWAVGSSSPLEIDQKFVFSGSCNSGYVDCDLRQSTVNIRNDSETDANNGAVKSSVIYMRRPVMSSVFGSSSDTDFSACHKPLSESSAAASSTSYTDSDEVQDLTDSQAFAASDPDMSSTMGTLNADVDDPSIPSLTNEGRNLIRRMSWPNDLAEPGSCPASRPRCLSLPSSFSDVILQVADSSSVQMLVTPEQLLDMFSSPEGITVEDYLSRLAASYNLLLTKPNSFPETASSSVEADMAPRDTPLKLIAEDLPSTPSPPSSPSLDCPFDLRPAPVSKGKDGDGKVGKATEGKVQPGKEEGESVQHAEHGTGDKGQVDGSRVKVERVPDADISTWHVLYELPLLPEQMDGSSWQSTSML